MLKELGFTRGVNLGGWMSQCDYSEERLNGFIREEDFARIAEWGLDHVRLPVDYNVLEEPDGKAWRADGFDRINRAAERRSGNGASTCIPSEKSTKSGAVPLPPTPWGRSGPARP